MGLNKPYAASSATSRTRQANKATGWVLRVESPIAPGETLLITVDMGERL
jgi:hypothetical protein